MPLSTKAILKVLKEEYISDIEYRDKQQRASFKSKGEQETLDSINKVIN